MPLVVKMQIRTNSIVTLGGMKIIPTNRQRDKWQAGENI